MEPLTICRVFTSMSLRGFDHSDSEYPSKMPASQISCFLRHVSIMSRIAFQSHNGVPVMELGILDSGAAKPRSAPRVYGKSFCSGRGGDGKAVCLNGHAGQ